MDNQIKTTTIGFYYYN